MTREFRLLVFDWDGTLMDSEARIVSCVRAAASDLELEIPADESIRNIIGLGLKEAVMTLFPDADPALADRLVGSYRYHFLQANETPSTLFQGALKILRALCEQDYLLAVATGTSPEISKTTMPTRIARATGARRRAGPAIMASGWPITTKSRRCWRNC